MNRSHLFKLKRVTPELRRATFKARREAIVRLRRQGMIYREIAAGMGIGRQRVRQIYEEEIRRGKITPATILKRAGLTFEDVGRLTNRFHHAPND